MFLSCSYPQFSSSEEATAIEEILQAYDDGDEEAARRVLSLPLIKYMDNAVRVECIVCSYLGYPQFSSSEEAAAIEEILQVYDDGDEEAARRVLSLPLIKYMDNAV